MLQRRDDTPHFRVTTLDGQAVDYSRIWQRRNLVLVTVPSELSESARKYVRQLSTTQFGADTACVVTSDHVEGLSAPGVLIADRWGEVIFAMSCSNIDELPSAMEILDWVEYMGKQCPECDGEAK
jgi:hypothetical protein